MSVSTTDDPDIVAVAPGNPWTARLVGIFFLGMGGLLLALAGAKPAHQSAYYLDVGLGLFGVIVGGGSRSTAADYG